MFYGGSIVACPCALALTAPFTMGNVLQILETKFFTQKCFGHRTISKSRYHCFDKTGTITTNKNQNFL
jgi:Cu+-exporting ATPase